VKIGPVDVEIIGLTDQIRKRRRTQAHLQLKPGGLTREPSLDAV